MMAKLPLLRPHPLLVAVLAGPSAPLVRPDPGARPGRLAQPCVHRLLCDPLPSSPWGQALPAHVKPFS